MSFVWTTSWIRCTLRCHIRNAWSLLKPVMEYVGLCMTMFFSFWILWFLFRSHFNFKSPVFLFRLRFLNVALEGLLCYGFTKNTHDIFIPPMFTIWHQRVPTLNNMIFPFLCYLESATWVWWKGLVETLRSFGSLENL